MKWMLVVMVLGTAPVKTGLLFDDLAACWAARHPIAREYADVANQSLRSAPAGLTGATREASENLIISRLSTNAITCIPHADRPD